MQEVLVFLDIVCGLVLLKLMTEVTQDWGWHDAQARWALLRRFVLFLLSVSLFVKAFYRVDNPPESWVDSASQIVILVALILFPLLRAFNVISQDRWGPTNGPPDHNWTTKR